MLLFSRKVAECLTKLPENVLLERFRFLYSFISFSVSAIMVESGLNQCTVYQGLDRGGVDLL